MILNQSWGTSFSTEWKEFWLVAVATTSVWWHQMLQLFNAKWFVCLELFEKLWTGLQWHMPSRHLMQTNCPGCYLRIEKLWTLALLSAYLIWSFLQCPSDIKKCTFSECRINEGKSAFKITSLWAGSTENLCPAAIASRALFIAAQTFPGKIIFLGCCSLLSWRICSYGNVTALAWVPQNSQQAILVTDLLVGRQEILVMLAKSQFPF